MLKNSESSPSDTSISKKAMFLMSFFKCNLNNYRILYLNINLHINKKKWMKHKKSIFKWESIDIINNLDQYIIKYKYK